MKMGMKNALCCFLLLVLVFGACFHLPFVAFCCSSLLFLVFEIESILSQKPKQANAFYCSLWLFVACFVFLWMFPFEHRIARCGFLLVRKTKTSNERQKMSKWKPGFSSLSKESINKERKRHDKAIEDLQRAQIEWAKKRQERLDYINNQIMKKRKAEKRFADLNSAMQQYFIVTGMRLEPLPPKPVLSDFYVPSEDHHNRELTFITLSMVGIGAFLWYSDK